VSPTCIGSLNWSVRAWRGLRYNQSYATKLEKKLAQNKVKTAVADKMPKANPFSVGTSVRPQFEATPTLIQAPSMSTPNPFDLGSKTESNSQPSSPQPEYPPSSEDEDESRTSSKESSTASLLVAPTSQHVTSPWGSAPAYSPLYLSTISEYLPPPPTQPNQTPVDEKTSGDWSAFESYESSLSLDPVFIKFTAHVSHEPTQCIRYSLQSLLFLLMLTD
jgi:pre-rRNA-processing protein TSR4